MTAPNLPSSPAVPATAPAPASAAESAPTPAAVLEPKPAAAKPEAAKPEAPKPEATAAEGASDAGSAALRVLRDDEPLVRLEVSQIGGPQLSDLRSTLAARQLISSSDAFVDGSQFPVPADLEDGTPYERVLSPERTLRLQGSGRTRAQRAAAKKDLFADKPPGKEDRAALPADVKAADAKAGAAAIEQAVAARLKIEHAGSDLFPGGLTAAEGDAVSDPIAPDAEGWRKLLERNNLFSGIRLDDQPPSPSPRVAFVLRGVLPRFIVHDESSITATATATATATVSERMQASFSSKIDKVEAEAAYAFVSTKFAWSRQQEQAEAKAMKTMFAVGAWNLPRVTVHLPPRDLRAAQGFTRAVQDIVDGPGPSERQFYRLQKLLAEHGQVWATEVTLGGQLSATSEVKVETGCTESQVQSSVQAAVALKFGPASGSGG